MCEWLLCCVLYDEWLLCCAVLCCAVQGADMEHVSTVSNVPSESLPVTRVVDDSEVKLLCAQLTLQTQQSQLLRAQVQLLRSQLSAETAARLQCQVQPQIVSVMYILYCYITV